jgi:hypothetical protein
VHFVAATRASTRKADRPGLDTETRAENLAQRAVRDDAAVAQRVVATAGGRSHLGVVEVGAQCVDDGGRLVEVDGQDADVPRRHGSQS